jgi:hypothetical protein
LQDPTEINWDNLNNIRGETSRHFRNKKRGNLKEKINELETHSTNNITDLYKGIIEFKRVYQHSSNLLKDKIGVLLADSHRILNRWKNYFSLILNLHRASDISQAERHTSEPLIPDPSPFEVVIDIAKLKSIDHQAVIKFRQN